MTKFRALEAALNAVWAMEPSALETLLTIAAREHEVSPDALEAYRAKTLANAEQATVRDGVAVLDINGALIKRATFFSAMSGATSYDVLRQDLQAAMDDPKVKAILLNIDSPGGEASGANELASAIAAAREVKPVMAYVNGMAASAAYWIGAAVGPGNIVIDATAILGSIGAQIAFRTSEDPKGTTSYRFVSSVSPLKNADPATSEGAAQMQSVVDAMGRVFVESVARNRGTDTETVLSDFGKGGILVGQDAIDAGLADRIGTFEGTLSELSGGRAKVKPKGAKMADETYSKADLDAAVALALASANARTASITAIGTNLGATASDIATAIAAGTDPLIFATEQSAKSVERQKAAIDAAVAAAVAGAKTDNQADALAALQTDEEAAAAAAASKGKEAEAETAEAVIARIAAA